MKSLLPKLRYSLRSLMIFTLLISLGLGGYLVWRERQEFQAAEEDWHQTKRSADRDFERLFREEKRAEILAWSKDAVLRRIIDDPDYKFLFQAQYWCTRNRTQIIPELIKLLKDRREPGLINTADLIIAERIDSGDLKFWGHGGVVQDDLFTVAGRASWLLKEITGKKAPAVHMKPNEADLDQLQKEWQTWQRRFLNRLDGLEEPAVSGD